MKIGLINLEPKYPNLALEKIRIYYRDQHTVLDCSPLEMSKFDKVYCSSIFNYTRKESIPMGPWYKQNGNMTNIICGGTGFDIKTVLPQEIEAINPRLNFGFTTRGCIRKCKFCVVPEKEGDIRPVGTLLDLWDSKAKDITLLDNNILALPDHFERIVKEAKQHKLRLDFNQGLDHRLLNKDIVSLLKSLSHKEYRFALDHINMLPTARKAIKLLKTGGINRSQWYVLTGFDSTIEEDMERLYFLRDKKQKAFVQKYKGEDGKYDERLVPIARWVNQHELFNTIPFSKFLSLSENRGYKKLFAGMNIR